GSARSERARARAALQEGLPRRLAGVLGRAPPRRHVRRSAKQPMSRANGGGPLRGRGGRLSGRPRRPSVARESECALQPWAPAPPAGGLARRRTRILARPRRLTRQRPRVSRTGSRAYEARRPEGRARGFSL